MNISVDFFFLDLVNNFIFRMLIIVEHFCFGQSLFFIIFVLALCHVQISYLFSD